MSKILYIFAACCILHSIDAASQRSSITSIVFEEYNEFEEYDEPEIDLTPKINQALTTLNAADAVINSIQRSTRSNSTGALTVQRSFNNLSETLVYASVTTKRESARESLTKLSNSISELEKVLSDFSNT